MDWRLDDCSSLPKRRLFYEPARDPRIKLQSPHQPGDLAAKSPIQSSSTQVKPIQDRSSASAYRSSYNSSALTRKDRLDPNPTLHRRKASDNENIRPEEMDLLNFQRPSHESINFFLRRLGLEEFEVAFINNQIELEDLPLLKRDDLVDMGIPIGPRNRILSALQSDKLEGPQSSRRESSVYQASPRSTCSKQSASRLTLREEVQQFISGDDSATDMRKKLHLSTYAASEVKSTKPPRDIKNSSDSMAKMIEDLTRRQEMMLKAIDQNSQTMRMLSDSRYQSQAPSPVLKPRSTSMRRV